MSRIPRRLSLLAVTAVFAVSSVGIPIPAAFAARHAVPPGASRVAGVAAVHGITEAELTRRLTRDKHLRIGRGRLMYQDAPLYEIGLSAGAAPSGGAASAASAAPLPAAAFTLHSLPGAKRVVYLDFDGHVLSNTAWNDTQNGGADIVCPPWDIEGGPSVFTETERARIVEIWQRVSEDYAPFAVDVTTEYPGEDAITRSGTSDDTYGMRVLISPISSYFGSYGGIAYLDVFDSVGDYYKPALVFPEMLANSAKYIGEACSHENGHTLGLYHDGTTAGVEYYGGHGSGETGWAPIMGNSYSRNVTQWSRGEYANANNTEDDLGEMLSNGLAYRPDDIGGTAGSAAVLPTGATIAVDGRIEQNTDVDVVSFAAGAGEVTLDVKPAGIGPNLDVAAELRDAAGGLVAASNPADLLAASITATVSEGTYYLSIRGAGKGDPTTGYSSYGSLGEYTVTGSVVPPTGTPPSPVAPVAMASGTPLSGVAPLNVQFDSAASYDPDGSIVSWAWEFGDGSVSAAANPAHTFTAAGNYTVHLTVTDGSGLSDSATMSIVVAVPNVSPVASIRASALLGTAPFAPQFSGSASSDADGSIVSWAWDFGDGTVASGASVSHTYVTAGTYTVRLTVTDDDGATGTTTTNVSARVDPAQVIRVASVQITAVAIKTGKQARANVRVTNAAGLPVSGVSVSGAWSGLVPGVSRGVTDAAGNVVLTSKSFQKSGIVSFAVSNLARSGYTYDPNRNLVSRVSVSTGSVPL
jgi:PKD repeat protein